MSGLADGASGAVRVMLSAGGPSAGRHRRVGAGLVRFGDFLGEVAVKEGRLVPVLSHCHDPDPQPIKALILPGRQNIPRVRAFVDFLKAGV